jgi:tetrapyrrole methylase family protein/MazG family protein
MTGKPRVAVVGLGPAGPDLLTSAGAAALSGVRHRYLRTVQHPAAVVAEPATSFDHLYEEAPTFEAVYRKMVEALVGAAAEHGEVAYAVPGSPLVAERTVDLLLADQRVAVDIYPAPSFCDLAWARLHVDPVVAGVRLVDGASFVTEAAGERGPLLVAQCWSTTVLSDIKLSVDDEPPEPVVVLQRLGLPDEAVFSVSWADLDRQVAPDHLTSLYIPRLAEPIAPELARVVELVRTLRARCPWDREQTHGSLARYLLEETYEALEAIDHLGEDGSGYPALEDELGDLLLQVCFHATLAGEAGQFGVADVARHLHDKLVARHPHVFGDDQAETAAAVVAGWERRKQRQLGRASIMDGIPAELPSLLFASKVLGRALSAGTGPAGGGPAETGWRAPEELAAAAIARLRALVPSPGHAPPRDPTVGGKAAGDRAAGDRAARDSATALPVARRSEAEGELGLVLLDLVALARQLDVDPEAGLRRAAAAYRDRFVADEAGAG